MPYEFDCPNGHLVVGPQFSTPRCPLCGPYIGERWRHDPYVMYSARLARERGLLQGVNMSSLQIAMLSAMILLDDERADRENVEAFERQMLLQDPNLYARYEANKANREQPVEEMDEIPDSAVEWMVPKSADEARAFQRHIESLASKAQPDGPSVPKRDPEHVGAWSDDFAEMSD